MGAVKEFERYAKANIYFPPETHKAVKQLARRNKRSMNKEMIFIVEEFLKRGQGAEELPQEVAVQ